MAKALLGKAALPFVTGPIGLLGSKPSWDLMQECDTLLVVGSSFPYAEFLPREGRARGVQIDLDGRMLSIRYPMEVNLTGDNAETLRALVPLLQKKPDRTLGQAKAFATSLAHGDPDAGGVIVQSIKHTLGALLPHRD